MSYVRVWGEDQKSIFQCVPTALCLLEYATEYLRTTEAAVSDGGEFGNMINQILQCATHCVVCVHARYSQWLTSVGKLLFIFVEMFINFTAQGEKDVLRSSTISQTTIETNILVKMIIILDEISVLRYIICFTLYNVCLSSRSESACMLCIPNFIWRHMAPSNMCMCELRQAGVIIMYPILVDHMMSLCATQAFCTEDNECNECIFSIGPSFDAE